jgi:hypothetical protein
VSEINTINKRPQSEDLLRKHQFKNRNSRRLDPINKLNMDMNSIPIDNSEFNPQFNERILNNNNNNNNKRDASLISNSLSTKNSLLNMSHNLKLKNTSKLNCNTETNENLTRTKSMIQDIRINDKYKDKENKNTGFLPSINEKPN